MAGEDEDFGSARITVVLDDTEAVGEARDLGLRIRRALIRATNDVGQQIARNVQRGLDAVTVNVRVEPDLRRFDTALLDGLSSLRSINIPVVPDLTGFLERVRALLAGVEIPVRVVPDLDDFDARIRAHRPPDVTVNVNPDVDTNRLTRALSGLSGIAGRVGAGLVGLLKFGAVGIAAAGAAQGVIAFTAALAPALGIVAAAPAAFALFQAAAGTLKLALAGVGDAFKSALTDDAKAFEKSLEGLAPAAQAAAREVRALKPQFDALKKSVQGAFFKPLEGQITAVAQALGGPLKTGMTAVSGEFGRLASAVLGFGRSSSAVNLVKDVFGQLETQLGGIKSDSVDRLLKAVSGFVSATLPAFNGLGTGIDGVTNRFAAFLERATESGQALSWVTNALAVFRQLGAIIGNVGSIIKGVFAAAQGAGGGLLNNLIVVTDQVKAFVQSTQGQEAIGALFGTIATIAAQLGPILAALVTQVGAIAPALAPIFTALGPALVNLINGLGPALATIAPALATVGTALADGLAALTSGGALDAVGSVIANLVTGLAPLLPLIGSLANVVLQILAPAFQAVIAALNPVIAALVGALMPILPVLGAAFQQILTAVIPLGVALGQVLGQAVASLGPLLSVLATAVAQVVTAFIPFVQAVVAAVLPALPPLIAAFQAVVNAIVPVIPPIANLLAALGPLAAKLVELVAPILQFAAVAVQAVAVNILVPIITKIVGALTGLANILTTVVNFLTAFVTAAIAGFKYLYNVLVGNSIIPDLVNAIFRFFASLPGRILGVIRGLISSVAGVFRSMGSAALSAITSFISQAISFLRGLPGKAVAALSSAKSALVSAGRDLIRGLISGIKEMAGSLVSAAKGVVKGAVDGAKSLLGIDSPSKVFAEIGRDTGRGFIVGLTGTAAQIKATIDKVTGDIVKAFKGKKTNLDDRLIASLKAGNTQLQTLATKRDAIIQKIADAQKFAADTSKAALSTFSLQNLVQGDAEVTTNNVIRGLKSAVFQVQQFTKQVDTLAKRGLNKSLLEQVIGLGAEKGAGLATALSNADKATIARINDLQKTLTSASDKLGRTGADALYDSGLAAGKGFLAGIKSQQKAIEKLMLDIAKGMQRAIRAALDIRSPSHVFAQIGEMTGAGLHVGLLSQLGALQNAARSAARGVVSSVSQEFARMSGVGLGGPDFSSPDNVIPLTRAQRSRQQAKETSTLTDALKGLKGLKGKAAADQAGGGRVVNNTFHISEVGNARATAHRVVARLALAGNL